jgi:hypothetical protein
VVIQGRAKIPCARERYWGGTQRYIHIDIVANGSHSSVAWPCFSRRCPRRNRHGDACGPNIERHGGRAYIRDRADRKMAPRLRSEFPTCRPCYVRSPRGRPQETIRALREGRTHHRIRHREIDASASSFSSSHWHRPTNLSLTLPPYPYSMTTTLGLGRIF